MKRSERKISSRANNISNADPIDKVQIYGAGTAGSFLYVLLKQSGFKVGIKDIRREPDCKCAWGIMYREANKIYKKIGIDLQDYVLAKPEYVITNKIEFKNKNVVIFDKKKLLEDVWKEIEFKEIEADILVDSTGHRRALLPAIKEDKIYPTIQTIEEHRAEENIYVYACKTGYAWAFPLGNNRWHVGAGDIDETKATELIKKLREEFEFRKDHEICKCKGKIRLLPPSKCKPFVSKNIVGIGEAIGCVSGLGEGNVPSLRSAEILCECLVNDELDKFESMIMDEFRWIEVEHKFIEAIQEGKRLTTLLLLPKVVAIESKRSAKLSIRGMRRLIKLLK